jgi:glycosyltransferase involved in cell wall biosynthesis
VYGISRERIEVVPNGVSDGFFNASRSAWESQYGKESFALCVGAVQPRKNQLLLAQACNLLRRKLVLIGSTLPGERHYGELVRTAMLENRQHGGQWIESLKNDDPLLRSAYAACGVFALLSTSETQPLCVMEAMAAKARVLLLKMPYSKGKLFAGIETVKLANAAKTAEGLREVWDHGSATNLSSEYSWSAVASKLQKLYQQISTQYFSP